MESLRAPLFCVQETSISNVNLTQDIPQIFSLKDELIVIRFEVFSFQCVFHTICKEHMLSQSAKLLHSHGVFMSNLNSCLRLQDSAFL